MAVLGTPGFDLQPSAQQVALASNYITNFDFLNQYLPDTYEKEFERYGNRTVASFLRMVGAEMPSNSDLIKWAEQGRLHTKYTGCLATGFAAGSDVATWIIPPAQVVPGLPASTAPANGFQALRVGQTVMISDSTAGSSCDNGSGVSIVGVASTSGAAMSASNFAMALLSFFCITKRYNSFLSAAQAAVSFNCSS